MTNPPIKPDDTSGPLREPAERIFRGITEHGWTLQDVEKFIRLKVAHPHQCREDWLVPMSSVDNLKRAIISAVHTAAWEWENPPRKPK